MGTGDSDYCLVAYIMSRFQSICFALHTRTHSAARSLFGILETLWILTIYIIMHYT